MISLQWFKDAKSFVQAYESNSGVVEEWVSKYDQSKPFTGHFFGGHDAGVVKATSFGRKTKYEMVPLSAGFIKQNAEGIRGPPVIVYNQRKCLPGKRSAMLKAQQEFADAVYSTKGVIAITGGADSENPDLVHDLQVCRFILI